MPTITPDLNSARQRRRRATRKRRLNSADQVSEIAVVVVLFASVLAIGTVHLPILLGISAIALIGGTIALTTFRRLPRPGLFFVLLAGFCLLQALPLPAGLVERISPAAAETWLRCLIPFGEAPLKHFPLSIDPSATLAEALKLITYAAVYLMARRVRVRRGPGWLAAALFASAVLVAVITLIQGLADLDALYGFYQPKFSPGRWHVGPLLNSNNFAGYTNLGLFAGIGLLFAGRTALPRWVLLLGLAVLATALCLSGSRGGVVSALAGGAVVLVWLARGRRFRVSPRQVVLGLTPLLVGIALAFTLGDRRDFGALASVDMQRKAVVWNWSLPMIHDHLLFGVGRGAFETGFSPYRKVLAYDWTAVITHAENFVVQWVAEWGVPVGLAAVIICCVYVLRHWIASKAERVPFLMMTGLAVLLLQNLADLGLEIPAVAIAAVIALAAGERVGAPSSAESDKRIGLGALFVALPALVVWCLVLAFGSQVEADRNELASAYHELPVRDAGERAGFRSQLREDMLEHPGEAFFPLIGGLVAYRAQDENPLPWVARALELAPANGRVHLALAQLMRSQGAIGQALLHLRYAAESDRTLEGPVAALAVRWAASLDDLLQAVPAGVAGDGLLLDACIRESSLDVRIDCFRRATQRNPRDATTQGWLARSLVSALTPPIWPCTGENTAPCAAQAEQAVRAMAKLEPLSWRPGYLLAKVMLARGDATGAAQLLARVCPSSAEGDVCARDAVLAAIKSGARDAISHATTAYAARACDGSEDCAEAWTWLGDQLNAAGQFALAVDFYSKAAEADPSAERWVKVADHATKAQLLGIARAALDRAARSPESTPETRARASELARQLANSTSASGL